MIKNKPVMQVIGLVIAVCLIMAIVDSVISPSYPVKSMAKIVLFLLIPIGYVRFNQSIGYRQLFTITKREIRLAFGLGVLVYVIIIGAYFLIGQYFDFSNVTVALEENIGVTKENFIFVALYIAVINSLLEEFFFRGFSFLALEKISSRKTAYLFSASVFSIYHVGIMISWFTPGLFILLIASLFIAGLLFNWLNERTGSIYPSWFVHGSANLAINTVGLILFGII